MKKKTLSKDKEFTENLLKLFEELFPLKEPMRVLSYEERESIPKDALNYIFDLKEKKYLDSDKFEKIMLLSTIISKMTDEKENFFIVSDIINFIYFLDNSDYFIPEILDMIFSGIYGTFPYEELN